MLAPTRTAHSVGPHVDTLDRGTGDPLLALAVDTLKQGVLLFDATGHVLGLNVAARRAIEQRTEVSLAPTPEPPHDRLRLVLRRSASQLKLERALRACGG
jgi:PAS domain-containing protein